MQLYLNSLMGTEEKEVLRSVSNPEEMYDAKLLKPPSFDGKDTMLINTALDTRETTGDIQTSRRDTRMTPYEKICGQKYRKEILPSGVRRTPQSHQRNGQSGEPAHWDAADPAH